MGFDLHGLNALSEKGEYFRNNCWWWRPLWNFVCKHCNNILTDKQQKSGEFNDCIKIGPKMSIKIADKLQETIVNGIATQEEKDNKKGIKEAKKHNKKVDLKNPISRDWREAYPFTVENLKEFIQFCRDSGGFTIC